MTNVAYSSDGPTMHQTTSRSGSVTVVACIQYESGSRHRDFSWVTARVDGRTGTAGVTAGGAAHAACNLPFGHRDCFPNQS